MEYILGIIVVVVVLYVIGRMKGAPDPSTQTDAWLQLKLQTENDWIYKYFSLPIAQQSSDSLKKMYDAKSRYVKAIKAEIARREAARGITAISQELQTFAHPAEHESDVPVVDLEEAMTKINALLADGIQLPAAIPKAMPSVALDAHGISHEVTLLKLKGLPRDEAIRTVLKARVLKARSNI